MYPKTNTARINSAVILLYFIKKGNRFVADGKQCYAGYREYNCCHGSSLLYARGINLSGVFLFKHGWEQVRNSTIVYFHKGGYREYINV